MADAPVTKSTMTVHRQPPTKPRPSATGFEIRSPDTDVPMSDLTGGEIRGGRKDRQHKCEAPPNSLSHSRLKELSQSDAGSRSSGVVGAGLRSWWQRQRERRQRESLQCQVEQQRRRLLAASKAEDSAPPYPDTSQGFSKEPIGVKVLSARSTPSGDGMSVSVEVNDDQEDFGVAEIRVEEEPPSTHPFCPYILDKHQMLGIARDVLPVGLSHCRWNRLYSLARDGDSFDAFMRRVGGASRTLLVVKTTRGRVLGGYADSPWESQQHSLAVSASFYGSAQACLFSVADTELRVYKWTGVNRYIQLCDVGNKMLAFGGGGDGGSFGLCIEQDFQRGSTGTCDTFGNEPLCDEENFKVLNVEMWAFLTGQF